MIDAYVDINGNNRHNPDERAEENTKTSERTMLQVFAVPGPLPTNLLYRHLDSSNRAYLKYRMMRYDPTIALGTGFCIAPVVLAGWSYDQSTDAPPGAVDYIRSVVEPLRIMFVKQALENNMTYGWAAFEKVWAYDERTGDQVIAKLKSLLNNYTDIMVDRWTGEWIGFRQATNYGPVNLDVAQCLLVNMDIEGTDWYGRSVYRNVETAYDAWNRCEEAASRYDRKIAGAHIVVKYPEGQSSFNGVMMDNFLVAKHLVETMQSAGAVAVPISLVPFNDDLDDSDPDEKRAFSIEILSEGSAQQGSFVDRQRYLDMLKIRGLGLPERSILEGTQGTKAEAATHGDIGLLILELRHVLVVDQFNRQVTNHLLRIKYGQDAENTVFIRPAQLDDMTKSFLMQLYMAMLSHADQGVLEADNIDTEQIRSQLGVPSKAIPEAPSTDPTITNPPVDPGPLPTVYS